MTTSHFGVKGLGQRGIKYMPVTAILGLVNTISSKVLDIFSLHLINDAFMGQR